MRHHSYCFPCLSLQKSTQKKSGGCAHLGLSFPRQLSFTSQQFLLPQCRSNRLPMVPFALLRVLTHSLLWFRPSPSHHVCGLSFFVCTYTLCQRCPRYSVEGEYIFVRS